MTTATQWLASARPRTLPAAVAPVVVGTGAAAQVDAVVAWKAALALVVALSLQVGVNYANDYSDGVRGTDASRVGPTRLVGSGVAAADAVRAAALLWLGVAAMSGLVLVATSSWWLLLVGAAALAAAWFYTGGRRPYGYRGLGEVAVFVFFGLVAVLGTTFVQAGRVTGAAVAGGCGVGALACAILVVNNLRDLAADAAAGKRTLAVVLGGRRTRLTYLLLVAAAYLVVVRTAVTAEWVWLVYLSVAFAVVPVRLVLAGASGPRLVRVLATTASLELVYAVLLGVGLALSG